MGEGGVPLVLFSVGVRERTLGWGGGVAVGSRVGGFWGCGVVCLLWGFTFVVWECEVFVICGCCGWV